MRERGADGEAVRVWCAVGSAATSVIAKTAEAMDAARMQPLERWWAPRRAAWWIGVLFAVGSTCFLVGPFPGLVELVGSEIDGAVFFVGSIFFTSAAAVQYVEGGLLRPRGLDWWS